MSFDIFRKKDFVIAVFFSANKKLYIEKKELLEDKKTFKHDNGLYVIDNSAQQFYTNKGEPVFFYVENIPNPLKFNFVSELEKYITEKNKNIFTEVRNKNNEIIDISYSSLNLLKLKQDLSISHLHSQMTPTHLKIIFMLIGVLALSLITIIIIYVLKR